VVADGGRRDFCRSAAGKRYAAANRIISLASGLRPSQGAGGALRLNELTK